MNYDHLINEIQTVSLSMFRKDFLGVCYGSISGRITPSSFMINKKEATLNAINRDSLVCIDVLTRDYRWHIASIDTPIHEQLYQELPQAKYVCYTMPPYATAYSLKHTRLSPRDYFGQLNMGDVEIYDPGNFSDWHNRAPYEIANYFKGESKQLILIGGYGLFAYDRNIVEMAKKIALVENSARLLMLGNLA